MSLGQAKHAKAPLNDVILVAVAKLVDDAQAATREPSHSDLDFQIHRIGLADGDPKVQGQLVGKAKRIRAVLSWALDNAPDKGEAFVAALLAVVKGKGGFRPDSPNYVGEDAITNAVQAFDGEGYVLTRQGDIYPKNLDTLSGAQLTAALQSYVKRAQRGSEDAALVVGTGKDLLEATAAHVLCERYGNYHSHANFATLLGQAFIALQLATSETPVTSGESPQLKLERALYAAACAISSLRNKQGTGHGKPWISTVTDEEARLAIQVIGVVSGLMLETLKKTR